MSSPIIDSLIKHLLTFNKLDCDLEMLTHCGPVDMLRSVEVDSLVVPVGEPLPTEAALGSVREHHSIETGIGIGGHRPD